MNARKKPGWAFWLTVGLILLPVLYVGSFGPVVSLMERQVVSVRTVVRAYRPLIECTAWFDQEGYFNQHSLTGRYVMLFSKEPALTFLLLNGARKH
jgi:hypothetical protein